LAFLIVFSIGDPKPDGFPAGATIELIKGAGRWSSNAFEKYIRKNVVVLHALILGRALHYSRDS